MSLDVISKEQSVFIKEGKILVNPLMLNEIVGCYKLHRQKPMVIMADFENAYDSLS